MAKIYITLEVDAKDKFDACSTIKSLIKDNNTIELSSMATTKPVYVDDIIETAEQTFQNYKLELNKLKKQ